MRLAENYFLEFFFSYYGFFLINKQGNEKKKLRYLKMKQGMLEKGHATEKEGR